ncbi:XRE family transcriptional regulator [Streptomyces venezuelae]|uniref:XRE family transcriptional regulator n=1 Tax=Streptomyces venezuelae TaxID=54571 RepID=A0A5P2D191_STRVZ|nr:helix-turn-helix transcriptional regulator [Streptomyces venezuelae]QES47111.1 XRE family transcriptional regulator [Streptomyces venezuelae]
MPVGRSSVSAVGREFAARSLGDELRKHRLNAHMSLVEAADKIRGSSSKLSRLERGESPPKEKDVWDLVRHYRVDEAGQDEIHELLSQVLAEHKGRRRYSDLTPGFLRRLITLEAEAARITVYETHVVPGLLQTRRYSQALVALAVGEQGDQVEVDRYVRVRRDRQALLSKPERPELIAILDESVLYRPVGGFAVMCEQLKWLREIAGENMPRANVRVLRYDHENVGIAPSFPLTHLTFADGGPSELVYLEQMESADYVTTAGPVQRYRSVLDQLMDQAVSLEETLALLDERIAHYEKRLAESDAEL